MCFSPISFFVISICFYHVLCTVSFFLLPLSYILRILFCPAWHLLCDILRIYDGLYTSGIALCHECSCPSFCSLSSPSFSTHASHVSKSYRNSPYWSLHGHTQIAPSKNWHSAQVSCILPLLFCKHIAPLHAVQLRNYLRNQFVVIINH